MLLHPPAVEHHITGVRIVGPIVQWACCLLLLGVFALLLPLTSQRRVVQTWMVAWAAELVGVTSASLFGVFWLLVPHAVIPTWTIMLGFLFWPARFVFLAAVALGALEAVGWSWAGRWRNVVLLAAAFWGITANVWPSDAVTVRIHLVATILVLFTTIECILLRARGDRRRGLWFLASTLTLFATVSAAYLLESFAPPVQASASRLFSAFWLSSGYGDAVALALLGCGVIVVIVQDAFVESRAANDARISQVMASEARLRRIIQATQEAIVTVDDDGRIELLNAAAESVLGGSSDRLVGAKLSNYVISEDATVIDGGRAMQTRMGEVRRTDGTSVPVEYTIGSIEDGGVEGAVVVLRDISARKAEAAEREASDRRAAEHDKMAAIGRVVSGVAHELNNPLAVVLGQSEQLVESAPTAELQTGLALIHEQAHRARRIVRDLLAFVRHRDGANDAALVSRLVERVVNSQRNNASVHGVTLDGSSAAGFGGVRVDRNLTEQVLVNLVSNAIDAAGDGGAVRVICTPNGDEFDFAVEDSGPGVPVDLEHRIFEPFFTTKDPGRGTGLGLSVSRGLAEQHGGELRLENRPAPGIGARFVLSVPLVAADVAPAPSGMATFPAPPTPDAAVLVIDDERSVRMTLTKMFRRAGWSTHEASGGDEALRWLETVPADEAPAVILCDLKMPGMNGETVQRRCADIRPDLAARFIFVTGDVLGSARDSFSVETRQEVIEKPFTIAEIAGAVERTVKITSSVA